MGTAKAGHNSQPLEKLSHAHDCVDRHRLLNQIHKLAAGRFIFHHCEEFLKLIDEYDKLALIIGQDEFGCACEPISVAIQMPASYRPGRRRCGSKQSPDRLSAVFRAPYR